ncbi:PH domain-containing protein [Dyadobacter crusticola]|uniref:PH domain-containing protein n=1 Tax=Dyadobacter crusticola TaxID=292407 RepID=UPI000B081221|nr:PH domain-containing protein [Dyadobacter crusticola]
MEDLPIKNYKSALGPELSVSMSGLLMIISILVISKGSWAGFVVVAVIAAFFLHLFFNTYYQIKGDQIRIRSGFLMDKTIPVKSITKISETKSLLSAPALSQNRLELRYNRFDRLIISPKDRTAFIADLLRISEHIDVQVP